MLAEDFELQRAPALRAVTGGRLRLRRLAAATRVELAMHRHMRALKYSPDQPRVPRDNPDGGQWTDGGGESDGTGASNGRMRLAGDVTGFTKHGINQTISRGVSPGAIRDAVVSPVQIIPRSNGTTRYVGTGAVVVLNPAGAVVTVWGR